MGAVTGSTPWNHIKIADRPQEWDWDISTLPCLTNLDGPDKKEQPSNVFASFIGTSSEAASQGVCHIAPGGILPYHTHEASELYLPLKGSCTLYINGEVRTISGDANREAVYIPSHCPHGLKNETNEPYEFFFLYYPKHGVDANTHLCFQDFANNK